MSAGGARAAGGCAGSPAPGAACSPRRPRPGSCASRPTAAAPCAGGRPRVSAPDSASVCATTTLSSVMPWMSSSGRDSRDACASSELASYACGCLVGVAEVALGVGGVVAPPVGDRGAGDRDVEDVGPAQDGERRQVAAERPAPDADPAEVDVVGVGLGDRRQRVDLVLQRDRREVPGDRAVPARSAPGGAPPVGDHDDEALVGQPLLLAEAAERRRRPRRARGRRTAT